MMDVMEVTLNCGCKPRPELDTMADIMPTTFGQWPCPLHGPQKVLAVYPKQIPITSWVDGPAACHVEWCTDCGGYGYTVAIHGVVQIGGFWDTPQAAIGAAYRAMDAISIELAESA